MKLPVALTQIQAAARTLAGRVRRTPLLPSAALSARLGVPVWLKAESLQIGGAFKARGATNCVAAALASGARPRGLATFSSGNHGQGVALAARAYGLPALVVMPEDAPSVKVEGARALGAEVVFAGHTSEDRRARCEAIAGERQLLVIPPFDHPDVVAGQGTTGLEIVDDLGEVAAIAVPCGGGGLVAGIAVAATETRASIRVYSAESESAPKMARSLAAGRIVSAPPGPSIADGLRPNAPGEIPFAIARERLAGAATVTDAALEEAMALLLADSKLVVEPSGAAGVAAALEGKIPLGSGPLVAVLSGGNVDPARLARVAELRPRER